MSPASPQAQQAANRWIRMVPRWLMCLLPLLLATLATSIAVAAVSSSDPDWNGTMPTNISNSARHRAWQPDIAIDASGRVVVVWSDEPTADQRDIYTSSNEGGAWSTPQVLSQTAGSSRFPDVLAVGDRCFVAWIDVDAAVYETEIGAGEPRSIPSPAAPALSQPSLAVTTDRLHIVFGASNVGVPDLYHASRPLAGASWPAAERIYTSALFFESVDPALVADPDGETLHLVWEYKGSEVRSIMYMSGTVSGTDVSWSPALTLSTGITLSIRPDIAVDSAGNPHVVWGELGAGEYNEQYVRYTRYDADAGSWTAPTRIDPDPVQVNTDNPTYISPAVALWEDGGDVKVCVAWYGFRASDPQAEEVLLRCSQDGGNSWPDPTQNVSRSTTPAEAREVSMRPFLAFDQLGQLHVVWQERAGSDVKIDYEVYYSRGQQTVYLPLVMRNQ